MFQRPSPSIQDFWLDRSQELGEEILERTLGRYVDGLQWPKPRWVLLYHGASKLVLRFSESPNWFQSFVSSRTLDPSARGPEQEIVLLETIEAIVRPVQPSGIRRLFSRTDLPVELRRFAMGAAPIRIEVAHRREEFFDSLQTVLDSRSS